MPIIFSTKAGTLNALKGLLQSARIAPLIFYSLSEWKLNKLSCLSNIKKNLGIGPWIVRSSCQNEDGIESSNAGKYLSILNVDTDSLEKAVEKVIESYGKTNETDQVLIQPMLNGVLRCGVAFSHDPNTCSPYRVVNWFEGSDTEAITGGASGRMWQQAAQSPIPPPKTLKPVLDLMEELLYLFDGAPLDFEFAITQEIDCQQIWLLQVRPLVLREPCENEISQTTVLEIIHKKIERGMRPHLLVMGQRNVYGVMPDWNPAEIIGIRPKPLALSLYRELITDAIWAYQRDNYGYRNLRSLPLMPHFFGLPYIDVRLSFNSFIPADLSEGLAGRLVDYYIERLLNKPNLHDKVEFEIVFSCYTLDLSERMEYLLHAGFSDSDLNEISESLRKLTNRIVHPKDGLWRKDANKINTLDERRDALLSSNADPLERIYWLIEDAKRYGTLPFAGLARAGFVAVQMLKSLVAVGVFSEMEYDRFMRSISTVSGQLTTDRILSDKVTFLSRYGHLRPGTYDILSKRYDEAPELYFDWDKKMPSPEPVVPFSINLHQTREIRKLLDKHGLQTDPVGLLDFMQAGIELREKSKFHFTRNLSHALELITEVGASYGFKRDDLAYCDISVFKELHVAASDTKDVLLRSIEQGRARYSQTLKLSLPPLITKPDDIWAFEWPEAAPNFITQKQVTAPVCNCDVRENLIGSIVCIPNADPGFDWLFAYPIAGLITAWGGVNSHMAVRAGEIGLPAVIGAGEILFRRWSKGRRLHLDCAGRRVEVLF